MVVDAAYREKAHELLNQAKNEPSGYLGRLTDTEQKELDNFRKAVGAQLGPDNGFNDRDLLRYLRAREWKMEQSLQMILATHEWRKTQPRPEDEVSLVPFRELYDSGECLPWGRDKTGRRAYFHFSRHHDPHTSELSAANIINVMRTYCYESDNEENPEHERFTVVFDLTGFTRKNRDMAFNKMIVNALQNHNPERLALCIFVNAPTVFSLIWSVVKLWLTQRTISKILFIGGSDFKEKMLCFFDKDQLPPHLGGTSTMTPQKYIEEKCGPAPPKPKNDAQHKKGGWFGGFFSKNVLQEDDANADEDVSAEAAAQAAKEFDQAAE